MEKYFKAFLCICFSYMIGCKSDLNLNNPNTITTSGFWKSQNDVESALASIYNKLFNVSGGYWGYKATEIKNGRGDDCFLRNDDGEVYQVSIFTNRPDNGRVNGIWNGFYQQIFRTNQIIENITNISMDDEDRNRLSGEAHFLRGLSIFYLALNFGDAPLPLKVPADNKEYSLPVTSVDSLYLQSIKDFEIASKNLPIEYSDEWIGRATKGAAIGYMGKIYLYMGKYAEAEKEFEEIMQPPFTYELMEDYSFNFDGLHENNKESLFEIQFEDIGGTDAYNSGAGQSLGSVNGQGFAPDLVSGWFQLHPTDKLFNEFKKEKTANGDLDPRMYASIIWDGEEGSFYQRPISDYFPSPFGFKARFKKYQNWRGTTEQVGKNGGGRSSSINETDLRFDDILLMHAESVLMQGRPEDAYNDVDRIRKRANLNPLPGGLNKDQMMNEIRHQRLIEFAREGMRFYDLKRWNLLEAELENSDKPGKEFFNLNKNVILPIPQNEIDANPMIKQKPGW